ncbi:MAG: HAD family phosphatase [Paracoccaceae bacterium]
MDRPDAVIFDIGNVLIEWRPERYYDHLMGRTARQRMFAAVDLHAMNEAIDRGAPFLETVEAWARAHPAWSAMVMHWHNNWPDLATPEIPETVATLRALKARGTAVFLLSNIGAETFALAARRYPFLAEADRLYLSGPMQVTKPDPRIYAMVEADCGLPPGKLLFVDDRRENIAAAAARGWRTHLFDGPAGWNARLRAEGILSGEETE